VVVDPLYDKMGLRSHQKTFLNYWMRHIWISVWPLFQGVLISAAILGVSVWQVVEWSWPATIFAVAAGVAVGTSLIRPVPVEGNPRDLTALWPLAAVAAFSFLMPLPLAVAAVYFAYAAVYKIDKRQLVASLKYASSPRILAIVIFSLVFAEYIEKSGISVQLAEVLGPYSGAAVFLVPFVVGLATGVEFTFAALAFPPILPLIHGPALALAFAGGFLGVMLSPAHSCLVLTREYYQADVAQVYRLLIKAAAVVAAFSAGYYMLFLY
jgi:Uncharacterized conserved protein